MRRKLLGPLIAAGALAALTCAAPAGAQTSDEYTFTLPAQDLSASLRAISLQTGQTIVASSDLVRDRQAPAISGSLTIDEAVRALLAGSGDSEPK